MKARCFVPLWTATRFHARSHLFVCSYGTLHKRHETKQSVVFKKVTSEANIRVEWGIQKQIFTLGASERKIDTTGNKS